MDRIEYKVDELLSEYSDKTKKGSDLPEPKFKHKEMDAEVPVNKISDSDEQMLRSKQEQLDVERKKRNIKKDRIARSLTGFSGGYSKGHQAREGAK